MTDGVGFIPPRKKKVKENTFFLPEEFLELAEDLVKFEASSSRRQHNNPRKSCLTSLALDGIVETDGVLHSQEHAADVICFPKRKD